MTAPTEDELSKADSRLRLASEQLKAANEAQAAAEREYNAASKAVSAIQQQALTQALNQRRSAFFSRVVPELKAKMQCCCDLDNWEPERSTGHSHVCRIHKAAMQAWGEELRRA